MLANIFSRCYNIFTQRRQQQRAPQQPGPRQQQQREQPRQQPQVTARSGVWCPAQRDEDTWKLANIWQEKDLLELG